MSVFAGAASDTLEVHRPGGGEGQERGPLTAVHILIPVWGYRFIQQFLEFCVPSLLAPGNIPAITSELPCRVVVMTRADELSLFEESLAWQKLKSICEVDIQYADDLITDRNHTATITLAYARAVRMLGKDMLNTLFLFLVCDYVIADGSLRTVLERVKGGASAVLAGNFQVVAEDAIPLMRRQITPGSVELALPPRQLMSWSLADLHPATAANMVNFALSHNEHSNRLFWRIDENTILGRFYLMHMIGIRPEVTDFVVGSSCDYSFVPEMCPSDNVDILTDSDDYLVVEMQPRDHEAAHLRLGPVEPKQLARSLAEWTTARHRKNVETTLVFHAEDIPPTYTAAVRESDEFIKKVTRLLKAPPQPHRMHPYWVGSIAAHRASTAQILERQDIDALIGRKGVPTKSMPAFLWRMRGWLFGYVPNVTPLHPRWPDFRGPIRAMNSLGLSLTSSVLVVAEHPAIFAYSLAAEYTRVSSLEVEELLNMPRSRFQKHVGAYDACFIHLHEKYLKSGDEIMARLAMMVKPGCLILLLMTNDRDDDISGFRNSCAYHASRFLDLSAWPEEIGYLSSSALRMHLQRLLKRYIVAVRRKPAAYLPLAPAVGFPLAIANILANFAAIHVSDTPDAPFCSSVFMSLRVSNTSSKARLPIFRPEPFLELRQVNIESVPSPTSFFSQSASLYTFLGALLTGRQVAQIGCADFNTIEVMLRSLDKYCIYSPNPGIVTRIERQFGSRNDNSISLTARGCDLLKSPLPAEHDVIMCIDELQNVAFADEQTFIDNMKRSLGRDSGLVVIGCPQTSEDFGLAPGSQVSYPRRGGALRKLLGQHFELIVMFSVLDGMILPGIRAKADYTFALCSGRKS